MDLSPPGRFPGELAPDSPSLGSILADESPLSTADTMGSVTTTRTGSSGGRGSVSVTDGDYAGGSQGTPAWMPDTTSLNNMLSENALESISRQRAQNKLIHLDPIPDFKDRQEIKPWLQKIFYPQGIEIVIERSDSIKVVFKCKATKRGRISRTTTGTGASVSEENPESPQAAKRILQKSSKKKRCVSPYNTCPFRVRATYSLKRKKWNIVVMNNGHSHELQFNADSDEYRKFKNHLREQQDWDAVRKFDELEVRSRFNLPIEPQSIPCDCGLTQEIKSFDIVLPTSDSLNKPADKTVSKPRHKSEVMRKKKSFAHVLSRNSTPYDWDQLEQQLEAVPSAGDNRNQMHDIVPPGPAIPPLNPPQPFGMPLTNWDPVDLIVQPEEIDFTNLFVRPAPRVKQEETIFPKPLPSSSSKRSVPELQTWDVSKSLGDAVHYGPSQPFCEINHSNECDCLPSSSPNPPLGPPTLDRDKVHRYGSQSAMFQQDPSSDGYLSNDLRNVHLTSPQLHASSPDPSIVWYLPNGSHPHEYSNDF
ncbi:LADA_0H10044g1_1 [Lachancea dasiensis]|uniref:LADA_0H10044g1_1 n=1 Tax=Lachancea dasiensis TaxID=1072105 RepID=A0A1G4K2Z4_9SACH|nr:LADA_0H10044g1_1 [Lachancea dasiensis]